MLRSRLETLVPSRDWSGITKQIGMFYYSGLSENQVQSKYSKKIQHLAHTYLVANEIKGSSRSFTIYYFNSPILPKGTVEI
jgi:aspartate/tyrosine/aromatic aminotransferase